MPLQSKRIGPNEIHSSMIFPSIYYCHNIGKIIECEQLSFNSFYRVLLLSNNHKTLTKQNLTCYLVF